MLALTTAAWFAWGRGLLESSDAGEGQAWRAPDISSEPEDVWSYTYLPRDGDYAEPQFLAHEDTLFVVVEPLRITEKVDDPRRTQVSALDLVSGDELWTSDIEDDTGGELNTVSFRGVLGGQVVVEASDTGGADRTYTRILFDVDDGSTTREDGLAESWRIDTESQVLLAIEDESLSRLSTENPENSPLWRISGVLDVHGFVDDFVSVNSADGELWVDADRGQEPPWFDGPDQAVRHERQAGEIFRVESASRGEYLDRLDEDGEVIWTADADSFSIRTLDSGEVAVLAQDASDPGSTSMYEYVELLDPRSGEPMWEDGIETDFDWVGEDFGDGFVLQAFAESVDDELYSLSDGSRIGRLRGSVAQYGSDVAYTLDEGSLSAVDAEGDEIWRVRARGATWFLHAPGYLLTRDEDAGRITRWE